MNTPTTAVSIVRDQIIEDLQGFILPEGDAELIADAILSGTIRNVRVAATPTPIYCVECGAGTAADCICDDLNYDEAEVK